MHPNLSRTAKAGFALMEVLLAMAIFTISAVALTEALSQMGLATVEAADKAWQTELIDSYLEEISKQRVIEEENRQVELPDQGYRIEIAIKPLELRAAEQAGNLPDLFEVTLELWTLPAATLEQPRLVETASTWRYHHLYVR